MTDNFTISVGLARACSGSPQSDIFYNLKLYYDFVVAVV